MVYFRIYDFPRKSNTFITFLATTGVVLGAAYSIWLYNRVAYGNLKIYYITAYSDMSRREMAVFTPLIFLTLLMGIYPDIFLDPMHASVTHLILAC